MLRFVDGFSHYDSLALLAQKWDIVNNAADPEIFMTMAMSGVGRPNLAGVIGGGVTFAGSESDSTPTQMGQYMQKNYPGTDVVVHGLAVKQTGTQCTPGARLLTFMDGNTVQVAINLLQSGQLRALRSTDINGGYDGFGGGGVPRAELTTLGQSVNAISSNTFDFLEFKITHGNPGTIEVLQNGAAFWTLATNTAFSGVNQSSSLLVGGYNVSIGGSTVYHFLRAVVTDVYLLDDVVDPDQARNPTTFIGDRHWEPLPPIADGADTAWTPDPVGDHFENVDTAPPNTARMNSTSTLNARDGFETDTPEGPDTASVLVSITTYMQKTTGGANAVKGFIRTPAPAYKNGTEFQVGSPWNFRQSFLCELPGGGPITVADVNAGQMGVEKTV